MREEIEVSIYLQDMQRVADKIRLEREARSTRRAYHPLMVMLARLLLIR